LSYERKLGSKTNPRGKRKDEGVSKEKMDNSKKKSVSKVQLSDGNLAGGDEGKEECWVQNQGGRLGPVMEILSQEVWGKERGEDGKKGRRWHQKKGRPRALRFVTWVVEADLAHPLSLIPRLLKGRGGLEEWAARRRCGWSCPKVVDSQEAGGAGNC